MELSELTAYAVRKYRMPEQHKWADFPGFSVLCHPQTGRWVALLMRQWDTESGNEIQRCDIKCGGADLARLRKPYLSPPIRMHGSKWVGVSFDARTEPEVVFQLLDRAVASNMPQGFTIEIEPRRPERGSIYHETALPFSGAAMRPASEAPQRLRELRRMFRYGRESAESRARDFYRQAVFMRDYEDDCPWPGGDFARYFPTYRDLSSRQLRGYFTWRAAARKGEFRPLPVSAAYIYVYELLNRVGADSPEDALNKLKAFENGYIDSGLGDSRMRSNLRRWMLEFAVINGLPADTAREYADPEMTARDDAIAALREPDKYQDSEVFSALSFFAGKKLSMSPVLRHDPERGERLFGAAWRTACAGTGNRLFFDCFGHEVPRPWYPLSNAVYYQQDPPADADYELNKCRSYHCGNGLWTVKAFETVYFVKSALQGFLHEADARLRRYLRTGSYLKERPEDVWAAPFIDKATEEDRRAALEASRPQINIDLSGLDRIRRDALVTRDSLLTEEETYEPEEAAAAPAEEEASDIPLDEAHINILRALLRGGDVSALLKAGHMMPTMAADMISEALFDEVGDTVVACEGDELSLVEDYREDLERLLGGTNNG